MKNLFGEANYNQSIPKFDGLIGAVLSLSFSLFAYVYILSRASFQYQSQNLIDLGRNLGLDFKQDLTTKVSSYGKNQATALEVMTAAGWK